MGWQDAPIVQQGTPSVTPAWQSAPIVPQPSQPAQKPQPAGAQPEEGHSPLQDVADMVKAVPPGLVKILNGMGANLVEHPILGYLPAISDTLRKTFADPGGTLSAVGSALRNATPTQVGENVLAPLVAGGVASEGVGAVSRFGAEAAAEAATPAGQLGLRTATGPGATMAGNTAGPTLDAQNLRVGTSILGADAGVPHSSPVNASTLETARKGPGNLLDAGYDLLPPSDSLSPAAQAQVRAARGPATITKPTPNITNQINDIESSLLNPSEPITGPSLRATRNSLSADAAAGAGSADADTRTIAAYKRNVVNALDQHLADSLPAGSPVTPDMIQNARSTLAKNYQLQDLIGKGGDIDLQALARLHRDNPNLLTGPTRTVAQFASDHPEVTGGISDNTRISPPSLLNDISSINVLQRPLGSVGQALFGAIGRRLLRGPGNGGGAIGSAMQTPVAGLGGEFNPLSLNELSPPSGTPGQWPRQTEMGFEGPPPSGGGSIPAPVQPPPSPSTGPMRQPIPNQGGGISFGRNVNPLGTIFEAPENGNADIGGAASVEANNRGTGNYIHWNGDTATPVLADATQIDKITPPKGSVTIDANNDQLVSSGNTPRNLVEGLLARWKAHKPLSDTF